MVVEQWLCRARAGGGRAGAHEVGSRARGSRKESIFAFWMSLRHPNGILRARSVRCE